MSQEYDEYLIQHKEGVAKVYHWIKENIPELIDGKIDDDWPFTFNHDASKSNKEEYEAYDKYFYGRNKSYQVMQDFNYAWLHHIHNNPHHWQYWILFEDNPEGDKPYKCLDMPYNYIIEMICDWWSFSWKTGNVYEMFSWYAKHKYIIKLSDKTRTTVENILDTIRTHLDSYMANKYDELIYIR